MNTNAPGPAPSPDDLPCALATVDAQARIVWANRAFRRWLSASRAAEGTPLRGLLAPGCAQAFDRHWQAVLSGQGAPREIELDVVTADAATVALTMGLSRRPAAGPALFDLVFWPDTHSRLQERELNESRDEMRLLMHEATRLEAQAQDRALFAEQMVGIVSHDLRNPLAAIHMGVLALTRGELSSNQIRVLGRVSRATERAHRLIADLLDFTAARVGSGLSVARRAIDLGEVVSDAVEELSLAFPERRLLHEHSGHSPCAADPDRLSQLVGNLVSNAMAYGDPTREVTVRSSVAQGSAAIAVHNWGEPIAPERIDRIFDPMVRGDARGQARSVGLGLYIVGEIAKAHGGTVRVRSSLAEGTAFTAVFPAA